MVIAQAAAMSQGRSRLHSSIRPRSTPGTSSAGRCRTATTFPQSTIPIRIPAWSKGIAIEGVDSIRRLLTPPKVVTVVSGATLLRAAVAVRLNVRRLVSLSGATMP